MTFTRKNHDPFSFKNLKVTTTLSAGFMKLTQQSGMGERGKVLALWDKGRKKNNCCTLVMPGEGEREQVKG